MLDFIKNQTPIVICDIGASPCDPTEHIELLLEKSNSFLYGFEPNENEYEKLKLLELYGNRKFYKIAVGDGKQYDLNLCAYPGWTSFLTPDADYISLFHNFENASKIISKTKIQTQKLDDINFEKKIDFFKIDTQGFESVIIENGQNKIKESLIIQVELSNIPLYKNEKRMSYVCNQLENLGFNITMFSNINTRTFKPMIIGNSTGNGLKTIFQLDCVFVKNYEEIKNSSTEQLMKLILIMFYCYKSYDFVYFLITLLDKKNGTDFINLYRQLLPNLKFEKKY